MTKRFIYLFPCFLLIVCNQSYGQNSNYRISEVPGWVEQIKPTYKTTTTDISTSSFNYLLINRQSNIREKQNFIHCAVKVLSAEGLREISNLTINFDPNYQELVLHKINVIREEDVINQLDHSLIQIVQREPHMHRHLYDGRLTAVINLKDIRIGDIIDYSYSIIGYNPVFKDHYFDKIYLQYSIPIEHLFIRLIIPYEKDLHFKYFNGAVQPECHESKNSKTYVWELKYLPIKLYDINTPSWYNPYPHVVISDYSSWENVVEWGIKLFSLDENEKRLLKENAEDIIGYTSIDSTIIRAIRFTQDDIRYLGFVEGVYSYKPLSPVQVLNQRYGDCKDKSFLLSELLKCYGIDSSPVLIHSSDGYSLGEYLPSPYVFNHCVVHLIKDGKSYFIDPTISNQGGDLEHYYFPNYHKGLIIRKGEDNLIDLPLSNYSKTHTTEMFNLENVGEGATLHVSTTFTGMAADLQREGLASLDLSSIQKFFIDFYSRVYPHIRVDKQFNVVDMRDGVNELTLEEFYVIDSVWNPSEIDSQIIYCEFYPLSLVDYVNITQSPKRSMPYLIYFPVDIEHETIIKLPEEWNIENDTKEMGDESFSYNYAVNYDANTIRIIHKYKTFNTFIKPEKVEAFYKDHSTIFDYLSFSLFYNKNLADATFEFSWSIGIIALITFVLSTCGAITIYNRYDVEVLSPSNAPLKIGGWLILVAIGFTFTPLRSLYHLLSAPEYFDSTVWSTLTDINASPRDALTRLLMFFELLYNVIFFVFSVLVVALFYKRRTILPKFAIIFFLVPLIFSIIDTVIALQLNPLFYTEAEKQTFTNNIIQNILVAAVWIPYFLISKRVKQTFVMKSPRNRTSVEIKYNNLEQQPLPMQTSAKPRYWLVFLVIIILGIFSYLSRRYKSIDQQSTYYKPVISYRETPFPDLELPLDTTYIKDISSEWNYAILQCVSRQNDEVCIRIITVREYADAEAVLLSLNQGAEFTELASTKSNHPTKSKGGNLGTFKMSDLNEQFQAALKNVEEGEYTGIIEMGDD